MPIRLTTSDADFPTAFATFLASKREVAADIDAAVREIVAQVRRDGDPAIIELTQRFDRLDLRGIGLRVRPDEIGAAVGKCDRETLQALEIARKRIEAHHGREVPRDDRYTDALGVELGARWTAVESVGIYVPGGLASYPSTVLMNAVPAQVAGVPRIAMAVPTPEGIINPLVLAAAHFAGVSEIYRIGGAQAIAAFAYGTASIKPVVKIVGPGNAYVAAAKRQVFGLVGIDAIAGPSEVLIIADKDNDPEWIAADLLAQAEHDTAAQAVLMTDDGVFADRVAAEVTRQLEDLPRRDIAGESWQAFGAIVVVRSLEEVPALADRIAPEHLQIATRDPDGLAIRIRNAGAIFLGRHTPEVIGDYVAGTNHVLPTARSARFSSGLAVLDFMKRTSILRLDQRALGRLGPAAMTLATAEGLEAHRRSVAVRLTGDRGNS